MMTIPEILNILDPDYLQIIAKNLQLDIKKHKNPVHDDIPINFSNIRENLTYKPEFMKRLNDLDWIERDMLRRVFRSTAFQLPLEVMTEDYSKKFFQNCISIMLIFAVPFPANAEYYIVPVEYELIIDESTKSTYNYKNEPTLSAMINNYNLAFLKKMCASMNTTVYDNTIFTVSDLVVAIMNTFEKNLSELPLQILNILEKSCGSLGLLIPAQMKTLLKYDNKEPLSEMLKQNNANFGNFPIILFQKGIMVTIEVGIYERQTTALMPDEIFLYVNSLIRKNLIRILPLKYQNV